MWFMIGTAIGMLALFFIAALIPYVIDLPESIAKYFGGRLRGFELERRLQFLEAQVRELRAAVGLVDLLPSEHAAWSGRLEVASVISDPDTRDETLAKLGEDATDARQAAIARAAIGRISNPGVKDEAASVCAIKLARAGNREEATEVAKSIADAGQRDETLAAMASERW